MLHAELHGKLSPAVDEPHRLEDALTSSVFGTLVMVGAWDLLAQWLEGDSAALPLGKDTDCWFWPRLAGAVEPDVVVRLGSVLVVVEAKYRSGRHDLSLEIDEDERPVDQIVRQHKAVSPPHDRRSPHPKALERAVRDCRIIQAFVVDGSRRMRRSRREHAESLALLPQGAILNLVTWQSLYKLLLDSPWSPRRWATDLRFYLELCGLASFQGISRRMTEAEYLRVISEWSPFGRRLSVPGLRVAAAALAAEPAIADLPRWTVGDRLRSRK